MAMDRIYRRGIGDYGYGISQLLVTESPGISFSQISWNPALCIHNLKDDSYEPVNHNYHAAAATTTIIDR